MQRFLLAILIVGAAVAAILVLSPKADEPGLPGVESGCAPDPVDEPADTPGELAAAKKTTAPKRTAVEPVAEPERFAGALLRVVEKKTGEAVSRAWVFFLTEEALDPGKLAKIRRTGWKPLELLEKYGRKLRTNAAGEVRLPRFERRAMVAARARGLMGVRDIRTREASKPTPIVLELLPEVSLTILVKDANGKPVPRVPVGLRADRSDFLRLGWSGVSDDDGRAIVEAVPRRSLGPKATRAIAFLNFPHRDGPTAPVDLDDLPPEPVELVLPPTGQVEVHVDGVAPARADGITVALAAVEARTIPAARADTTAGRALFPFVGLGMKMEVAIASDDTGARLRKDIDGPRVPGQRVSVRIDLRSGKPIVVGRLIDEKGDPVANRRLRARLRAVSGHSSSSRSTFLTTDGEGRFRMEVTDRYPPDANRTLQIRSESSCTAKEKTRMARAVLPRLDPGDNDIGVLPFALPPLVCSGVVLGAGGEGPISNARVHIHRKVVYNPSKPKGFYWTEESGLSTSSGADGRFECRGIAEGTEVALSAEHEDYLPTERQPFQMGAAGLQVLMTKAGMVEGSVLLEKGVESHDLFAELVREGDDSTARARPDHTGSFRFSSLKPGVASVRLRTFGSRKPFFVVSGVAVRSGEITKDRRLQNIKIEGVRTVTCSVVDQAGQPIRDAVVVVLAAADQKNFEGHILPRGKARVVTSATSLDVFAYAKGYKDAKVRGVTSGQKIVLGPAIEVRLSLPRGIAPPGAPYELEVRLEPLDPLVPHRGNSTLHRGPTSTTSSHGAVAWADRCEAKCDARGRAVILVPSTGRYRVRWRVYRTAGGGRSSHPIGSEKEADVIRVDGSTSLDVTGTFTQEALAKARARLAKARARLAK